MTNGRQQNKKKNESAYLPAIAPITDNGKVTRTNNANITKIVPTGNAAVDVFTIATVFTKLNTAINGAGNINAFKIVFHTQFNLTQTKNTNQDCT